MAGPGGGPSRKSHTKSKTGCRTCKNRRIRCDETFPQCRNCTKHSVRCDYQDQLAAGDDYGAAASTSTSGIRLSADQEVDQWLSTGVFPFPELAVQNTGQFMTLPRQDLRLLHYLCNVYRQLYEKGAIYCAPWISQLPTFLEISGRGHTCVLSALLAFAAQRMAMGATAAEMINKADMHRTQALQITQQALGSFSRDNADSILATSIILSWQVEDFASWNSLMQGIKTVINHMGDWRFASPIASFAESYVLARPTPMVGSGLAINHSVEAMRQFVELLPKDSALETSLHRCWKGAQDVANSSRTMTAPQLFSKLAYLRNRVLWAPLDCLNAMGMTELPLIAITQCFAMACAVDTAMPELNGACLGSLTPSAIDQIDSHLQFTSQNAEQNAVLTQFPRHMLLHFPQQSTSADAIFSFPPTVASPYVLEAADLHPSPGTPPYPPMAPYMESPNMSEISMPPSPYLASYGGASMSSGGHRHSAHYVTTPRPGSIYSDRGSLNVPLGHDSPRFSPAYSPQPDTPSYLSYGSEQAESPVGSANASGSPSLTRTSAVLAAAAAAAAAAVVDDKGKKRSPY